MNTLDPLRMPLAGLQVIEASAGTGKTWTLAALYVRLVLGHGRSGADGSAEFSAALFPPQILVMTFTDAATAELRGRVRERLAQAALYFKGQERAHAPADGYLQALRSSYPAGAWPACAQRLDLAAQWMDDAAIYTIHGWSSRMLKSHAFDSAALFQQSHVEDREALRLSAVQDYWRQWFYGVPLQQLGALQALGADPEALQQKLKSLWAEQERAPVTAPPAGPNPRALLQAWEAWQSALPALEAAVRQACTPALLALLEDAVQAKLLKGYRRDWPPKLADWLQGGPWQELKAAEREKALALLQRFTRTALLDKGWAAAGGQAGFAAIESLCQHLQAEPDVSEGLLQHAASHIAQAYARAKAQLAQFDFSDLLQRLYFALQAPDGRLAQAIRQQFPVALVDEFQDTDPWQYGALSKIYGASQRSDTGLLMIGDPKQAIYSFRGADLDTYLAARQQAQGIYTLAGNYRSTAQLVSAVNHVFGQARQPFGEVPFEAVQAQNREVQPLRLDGRTHAAMTVWHLPRQGDRAPRKEVFQRQMAALFASQMVALLQAGAASAGDMAVLVRSATEARAMRQALAQRGVRSVFLSERDSVYATQEAQDLWRVLAAVAQPRSNSLLRAALATRLWGLGFGALEALLQDEAAWEARVEQFHGWQAVWQRQGLLPMLHRLLHDEDIPARLLQTPVLDGSAPTPGAASLDGERRLCNLLHLGDLLQNASAGLQGEAALVRFLEQQLQNPKTSDDNAQLRLESESQLVQIITIHKSKGLQYPLVFLPFVSGFATEKDSNRDDAQRLAEDVRLLYVALTRAERALWLGITPYKGDVEGQDPKVRSAVSQLLQRKEPGDLAQCLQAWAACPDIVVASAPAPSAEVYQPVQATPHWKPALQARRLLASHWWSASFSALTREPSLPARASAATLAPLPSERDARMDDARLDSAGPPPQAALESAPQADAGSVAYQGFPAGSSYGTLLHDLLEWQCAHGWPLAAGQGDAAAWTSLVQRKSQRLQLELQQLALLQAWLQATLQTPLALAGATSPLVLGALAPDKVWAEMGFTLPVHALSARRLDALISAQVLPGQARRPLQPVQLEGMLVGFMDLVLEHEGRYYVLDYKSNRLPHYAQPALQAAMLDHRYDVQYTLYTLALHRLLKARLPGYDYARHMGGAIYLFLRGIDQPGSGTFADRPSRELIEALDAAFAERRTANTPDEVAS